MIFFVKLNGLVGRLNAVVRYTGIWKRADGILKWSGEEKDFDSAYKCCGVIIIFYNFGNPVCDGFYIRQEYSFETGRE